MKSLFSSVFLFVVATSFAQFKAILISKVSDPEEVSIAINPKNTKQIIGGANLANAYVSNNGGLTWERNVVKCDAYGVYGDPVCFWDTLQNAYFMHLSLPNPKITSGGSWVDRIVTNKSTDFGVTYPTCSAIGKNGFKVQDKHWACVDLKTNDIHVSWTQFDKYESKEPQDSSIILYSNSKDAGQTWETPIRISHYAGDCADDDKTVEGAVPAVGPNGEIYVAWAGERGLMFNKSTDGGKTFLKTEKTVAPIKNGWVYDVDGIFRSNGLPFTSCDLSNGPNRGRIYICWGDEKNGEKNKDVFLVYSDDKGETWTDPIVVTYFPNHKEQFMPYLTIDQSTGYLYILYYSRQNYLEGNKTDVYCAVSKNGGLKFDYYKINEKSFTPQKSIFFGDYIGISAVKGEVRPIWMEINSEKQLEVYTAIINDTSIARLEKNKISAINFTTNKLSFKDKIKVEFNSSKLGKYSVALYNPLKSAEEYIVAKNKKLKIGNNKLLIDTKKLNLKKGTYVLFLYNESESFYTWIFGDE